MAKSNRTHSFDIELASLIGIEKAIIVSNVDHWCTENELKKNKEYLYFGSYWTKESLTSLAKKYPYMKRGSISRWVNELSLSGWVKMIQTPEGNIYQRGEKFKRWNAGLPIELTVSQNEIAPPLSQNEIVAMSQNEMQGGVPKWDANNIDLINVDSLNIELPANAAESEKEIPTLPLKAKKEKKDAPAPRRAAPKTGRKGFSWSDTLQYLQDNNPGIYMWSVSNSLIWDDYMEHRVEIGKAAPYGSPKSEALAVANLHKLSNGRPELAQAIVNQSRANGWQGLFLPTELKQQQNTRQQASHPNGTNPYTY